MEDHAPSQIKAQLEAALAAEQARIEKAGLLAWRGQISAEGYFIRQKAPPPPEALYADAFISAERLNPQATGGKARQHLAPCLAATPLPLVVACRRSGHCAFLLIEQGEDSSA